jgi:putative membrane protein
MNKRARKPAAFDAADPRLVIDRERSADPIDIPDTPEDRVPDFAAEAALRRRRGRWSTVFWLACFGLLVLGLGLAVAEVVEGLFARSAWLGGLGLTLAAIAASALAVLVGREAAGLMRLNAAEALRLRAAAIVENDNREEGRALVADLIAQTRRMPRLARSRARLEGHLDEIIDGRDLLRLAERELMAPLDAEARGLVSAAGKRVSVVTAVSPRATFDVLFVLINSLSLIRALATLYDGRPGTIGLLRLFRQVVAHLAVTGGVAVTDGVIQQMVGHGLAARLSARLGEGMLNGLLTARLGLLTIDLVRPLPFHSLPRPSLSELAAGLLRSAEAEAGASRPAKTP